VRFRGVSVEVLPYRLQVVRGPEIVNLKDVTPAEAAPALWEIYFRVGRACRAPRNLAAPGGFRTDDKKLSLHCNSLRISGLA
jgi:hypothetical protein